MKENRKLLKEVLKDIRHDMSDEEVLNLLADSKISVSPESEKEKYTLGQRAADVIAKFAGSWAFIFSFTGVLVLWMIVNTLLAAKAFDPYPFILLNLVLSCVAAIQAPLIMMSQNRQEEKDRRRAENDYKVNLKTEIMIEDLYDNGVGGDLGQQRGLLLRLGVGVELGGDRAVHNAALPQGAGQAAGVDALNADDAVLFQEGIQRFLTAEVGRGLARLAHNVAPGPNLRALDILTVHAVVADERIGLGDDLAVVAGVGQGFLKADHTGCKDDLTDGGTGAAYADAAEHPAIGQYQICLHSW